MKTNACSYAVTLGLCLTIVACGGEDPPSKADTDSTNGTDSTADTTGTTTSTTGTSGAPDYFPMVDGASWRYFHTSNGGWEETVTLTDNGDGTFTETDSVNPDGERSESIHVKEASGRVVRLNRDAFVDDALDISVEYSEPGFVRFDPAWLSMANGETVEIAYTRVETPAGGTPDPERARNHIYTKIGMVDHTVQGVSYSDCLQMQRQRDYLDPTGVSEDQTKQFWFCPGVGKIQEVTIDTGNSEQLVESTIP